MKSWLVPSTLVVVPLTLVVAERLGRPREQRVAVVSNFAHQWVLQWLNGLNVQEVGFDSPRRIGESRPWLQWIVDNYDKLPEVTIFLHGHQSSWHRTLVSSAGYLQTHTPVDVTMLADRDCVWRADLAVRLGHERLGLNALYRAFWDKDFADAYTEFRMGGSYVCCAENMVSKKAIGHFSRPVYEELVKIIDENPAQPWGWVWERTWQNLWSHPTTKSDEQIIESLKTASSAMSKLKSNGTSIMHIDNFEDLMRAMTICGAPM